jgi:hypothetical protein
MKAAKTSQWMKAKTSHVYAEVKMETLLPV